MPDWRGEGKATILTLGGGYALRLIGYTESHVSARDQSFLFGFPAAFPFTVLAVRAETKQQRLGVVAVWTLLAFTAFFWSCLGLLWWKG